MHWPIILFSCRLNACAGTADASLSPPLVGRVEPAMICGYAEPPTALFGRRIGASPSGKALDFDSSIRRFDPFRPSHSVL
jgi:hypothetical protein